MKILAQDKKHGIVKIRIESTEDLWHLEHIIAPKDEIKAKTYRRVQSNSGDDKRGEKKAVNLKISVEKAAFHKYANNLRITGTILEGPEDISHGSYHTLAISPQMFLTIKKNWSNSQIERLKEATKLTKKVMVIVVEPGYAHIAIVHGFGVKNLGNITENLPSKRIDPENYTQSELDFYKNISSNIKERLNEEYYGLVIAGPGWAKDKLSSIISKEIPDLNFVVESISSVGPTGVSELLNRGTVSKMYADSRTGKECQLVEQLMEEIGKDTGAYSYGFDDVSFAAQCGAIKFLLISDEFFRNYNQGEKYDILDKLMETVNNSRGEVIVVSTEHEGGEKLDSLGGIAALLRYPLNRD